MSVQILVGDCRQVLTTLPDESVHCCVTSPPYFGLRDYGVDGQMGLEPTPDEFVASMVEVFREVRRVLRDDGVLFLNIGDSYHSTNGKTTGGCSPKSTLGGGGGRYREGSKAEAMFNQPGARVQRGAATDHPPTSDSALGIPKLYQASVSLKPKDLIGIPWMLAFALRADGWYLRQDIIWSKPNPMPESVRDRCTKAHEYLFLLSKGPRYHYDADAIQEKAVSPLQQRLTATKDQPMGPARAAAGVQNPTCQGGTSESRNRRSVWEVATQPFSEAHFATYPPALIEPCILAGCPKGGTVLDPFFGAGTTGLVADRLQRDCIGIELNPEYAEIAERRLVRDRGGLLDAMEAA